MNLVGPLVLKSLETEITRCMALISQIKESEIADLGSGAGIPGIPYAVLNPDADVKLIERSEKKCIFLKHVVSLAGLSNVEVVNSDPLLVDVGKFKAVISRAFSPRENLTNAVAAILKDNGLFYYIASYEPELNDSFKNTGAVIETTPKSDLKLYSYKFNLLKY